MTSALTPTRWKTAAACVWATAQAAKWFTNRLTRERAPVSPTQRVLEQLEANLIVLRKEKNLSILKH